MKQTSQSHISVVGAKEHNLKNVSLAIPKNKLIVFTGVSGSGKSSMAFDTIYAEGQRRYIESLSSYARQFLGQMDKPKYDSISGLSPTISIEQKAASKNPRSTVGTITEVYDYLRVLFARLGTQYCLKCGKKVGKGDVSYVIDSLCNSHAGDKIIILAPKVDNRKGTHKEVLQWAKASGFQRVRCDGVISNIDDISSLEKNKKHSIEIVIDRLSVKSGEAFKTRLTDSVEQALQIGEGNVIIFNASSSKQTLFSENNTCCGISYPKLDPPLFSFNSPQGMCEECNGIGTVISMDESKIIADKDKSIAEGTLIPWANAFKDEILNKNSWTGRTIQAVAKEYKIDIHKPWKRLSAKQKSIILHGDKNKSITIKWAGNKSEGSWNTTFEGVLKSLLRRYKQTHSESMKNYYQKFMSTQTCGQCGGSRLKPEIEAIKFHGKSITEVSAGTIEDTLRYFKTLKLTPDEKTIGKEIIKEISSRIGFLFNVGLGYLTLDRKGPTLSGGEAQRIRLASQVGSELTGVLYILDEPSIGLHQKDNNKLLETLLHLKKLGNTLIVVEHDKDTIEKADWIVDFGPGAGTEGGKVIHSGEAAQIKKSTRSLTGKYLSGKENIPSPECPRSLEGREFISLKGVSRNNIKNLDVSIPLNVLTCVTGVSGAGKSTLVNQVLYPIVKEYLESGNHNTKYCQAISGLENIDKIINIDQRPIGRTPRSNPATYTKLFDHIRDLFSELPESKARGYKKGRFSFNVKGGRCEICQGDGFLKVEMHFLSDVYVPCHTCHGKRFNKPTLEVRYKGLNIADVLEMPVKDAYLIFKNIRSIEKILKTLMDVGLGYIALGQSATTLSGGEAQRIKLSRELAKNDTGNTLYILDEPTTGLHFHDISNLIKVIQNLVDKNNTVIIIEHNLDIIKNADWIIDLGPEGGSKGGRIIAEGVPKSIVKSRKGHTAKYLKQYVN